MNCWEVRVTHCYREGNKVADKLANSGVDQVASILFFNNPLGDIVNLLHEDIVGVTTPCFIS